MADARRRGHRGLAVVVVVAVVLALAVIAFFVTDPLVRQAAEARITQQVRQTLPDGVSASGVTTTVAGRPVLLQLAAGRLDDVRIASDDVDVDGTTIAVRLRARGLPTDTSKPVDHLTGTITAGQAAVARVVKVPGAESTSVSLADGAVVVKPEIRLLGIAITARVTGAVHLDWPTVTITPRNVSVASGSNSVDLSGPVKRLFADRTLSICAAQYLPEPLSLTSIRLTPGTAVLGITGDDVALDDDTLSSRGSCG